MLHVQYFYIIGYLSFVKKYIYYSLCLLSALTGCKKNTNTTKPAISISHLSVNKDTIGVIISIFGQNFDKAAANNTVTFNQTATIASKVYTDQSGNTNQLDVIVPIGATTGIVSVSADNQVAKLLDTFYVLKKNYEWVQLKAFPGGPRMYSTSFTVNGNSYVGTGMLNTVTDYSDLWEYNQANDSWAQKAGVPVINGTSVRNAFSFTIGNYAYVGGGISSLSYGEKDVNKYDPVADKWTNVATVGGSNSFDDSFAGTYQNKGYIFSLSAGNNQVYQYDPVTNLVTSTQVGNGNTWCLTTPTQLIAGGGNEVFALAPPGSGFTILRAGGGYVGEFVPTGTNVFTQAVYYNNGMYMSYGDLGKLVRLDLTSNTWSSITQQTLGISEGAVCFIIGTKIYAVGGGSGFFSTSSANVWVVDLSPYLR